jgi:hypothetical protein
MAGEGQVGSSVLSASAPVIVTRMRLPVLWMFTVKYTSETSSATSPSGNADAQCPKSDTSCRKTDLVTS